MRDGQCAWQGLPSGYQFENGSGAIAFAHQFGFLVRLVVFDHRNVPTSRRAQGRAGEKDDQRASGSGGAGVTSQSFLEFAARLAADGWLDSREGDAKS